jgi:hypothetical protein
MQAGEVLMQIRAVGSAAVVRTYFGSMPWETQCGRALLDSIATGDSLWLVVAGRLAPSVDACSGEGLNDALASALLAAPERVLELVASTPQLDFDWICTGPGMYDAADTLRADSISEAHRGRAITGLRRIAARHHVKLRDACIARESYQRRCPATNREPCAPPSVRTPVTDAAADSIVRILASRGIPTGLERMLPGAELPPAYRARILRGEPTWLALAGVVATAAETTVTSKGGRRTMWALDALLDALADALEHAPEQVLAAVASYRALTLGRVCHKHALWQPDSAATAYRVRAMAALQSLGIPEYRSLRDACLVRLRN